jgi:dsDNA-binding SOS-regulon protein
MAVVTLYMYDRDTQQTFTNKKDADAYDKMLELAENITALVSKEIKGLSDEQCENIGILLSQNKELLATAIKGKPEVLLGDEVQSLEA